MGTVIYAQYSWPTKGILRGDPMSFRLNAFGRETASKEFSIVFMGALFSGFALQEFKSLCVGTILRAIYTNLCDTHALSRIQGICGGTLCHFCKKPPGEKPLAKNS